MTKLNQNVARRTLASTSSLMLFLSCALYPAEAAQPEKETLKLSQMLRPISDQKWNEISAGAVNETYVVQKGDSLYRISQTLFGDGRYWPKIWALNNGRIKNPHLIYPGNSVVFSPGTLSSLPTLAVRTVDPNTRGASQTIMANNVADNVYNAEESDDRSLKDGRSTEWKRLPRQRWEIINLTLPPEVDPQGFDRRNRITFRQFPGFSLKAIPSSEPMPIEGEIVASQSANAFLTLSDIVYIKSSNDLKVGETYMITQDPEKLTHSNSDRTGLSYLNMGTVKIMGFREDVYIGSIIETSFPIARGTKLIRTPTRMRAPVERPASSAIEATLLIDRSLLSTYVTAQAKFVFIDRGSDDGVEPGNVFRAYQKDDPVTEKKITNSDYVVDADFLVIRTSPKISMVLVTSSVKDIREGRKLVALTNLDGNAPGLQSPVPTDEELDQQIQTPPADARSEELDDLDSLDGEVELSEDEKKELQQLEDWDGDQNIQNEAPADDFEDFENFGDEMDSSAPAPPPASEDLPPPDNSVDDGLSFEGGTGSQETDDFGEELSDDLFDEGGGF